jgi:hypothetical protein
MLQRFDLPQEALVASGTAHQSGSGSGLGHSSAPLLNPFGRMTSAQLADHREVSRTFAEHLSCSLKFLRFVPMHSDSQQCFIIAFHGDNTGSNPVGDAKLSQQLGSGFAFHS